MRASALLLLLCASAAQAQFGEELGKMWSQGKAEGRGRVRFTHSPMRVEDIGHIIPLGLVVGAHVTPIDHQYYAPKDPRSAKDAYEVFSPADGFLVQIQHRVKLEGTSERQREYDDYRLVIEHSGTHYTILDLLTSLDAAVLAKLDPADVRRFENREGGQPASTRIAVKGGQVIGRIGGRTLDISVVDTETTLKGLLVPEHYRREAWKPHVIDPFECYDEPLKSQLLALNPRSSEPRGGRIDYDVEGRLVGNWFQEGTNGYAGNGDTRGYWMGHLSVVYHQVDSASIVVSIGDWDGHPGQFFVAGNAPEPALVGVQDGVVAYELTAVWLDQLGAMRKPVDDKVRGVVLFQVLEDGKLRMETFPGMSRGDVKGFTSAARTYER